MILYRRYATMQRRTYSTIKIFHRQSKVWIFFLVWKKRCYPKVKWSIFKTPEFGWKPESATYASVRTCFLRYYVAGWLVCTLTYSYIQVFFLDKSKLFHRRNVETSNLIQPGPESYLRLNTHYTKSRSTHYLFNAHRSKRRCYIAQTVFKLKTFNSSLFTRMHYGRDALDIHSTLH